MKEQQDDPFKEFGGTTVADDPFTEFGGSEVKKNPSSQGLPPGGTDLLNGSEPSLQTSEPKIKFNQLIKNLEKLNSGRTDIKDFADPRLNKLWQQTHKGPTPKDFIEKGISKTFDFLGDQIPTRVKNAWEQGKLQGEMANLIPVMSSPGANAEEIAGQIASYTRLSEQIPQSPEAKKLNENGVLWAFKNPVEGSKALGEVIISSLAGQIKAAERTAPTAVATGAAMGSAIPVIGTGYGAISGFTAGQILAGLNVESSSTFLQVIKDAGFPLNDEEKLAKAFSDKKLVDKARDLGIKRGLPIAIFDLMSAGIGGRLAASTLNKVAKPFAVAGVEALGGSTGELAAQVVSGQKIDPNAIALEGIAELGSGAPALVSETGGNVLERKKTSSSNQNIVKQVAQDKETGVKEAKENLDRNLKDGLISPEEHAEGTEFVDKVVAVDEKIPAKVEGENREKSIELVSEKEKAIAELKELAEEKKKTDDAYHEPIEGKIERREEKVKKIDKELKELAVKPKEDVVTESEEDLGLSLNDTPEQTAYKIKKRNELINKEEPTDAIPISPAEEISVQPAPGDSREVVEGIPGSEVVAEESISQTIPESTEEKVTAYLEQPWFRGNREANKNSEDQFFSGDESVAGDYAITETGDKPQMSKLSLEERPKNPLIVGSKEDLVEVLGYDQDPLAESLDTPAAQKFDIRAKKYAQTRGHDAIIYESGTFDQPELHLFGKDKPVSTDALQKAESDLETLKKVEDKTKKYEASMKRLTDAKNDKQITEKEFNAFKERFDEVLSKSAPKEKVTEDVSLTDEADNLEVAETESVEVPETKELKVGDKVTFADHVTKEPDTGEILEVKANGDYVVRKSGGVLNNKSGTELTKVESPLYHGTTTGNEFDVFDFEKANTGVSSNAFSQGNNGVYLIDSKNAARYFSRKANERSKLREGLNEEASDAIFGNKAAESENVKKVFISPATRIKELDFYPTQEQVKEIIESGEYDGIRFEEKGLEHAEDIPNDLREDIHGKTTFIFNKDVLDSRKPNAAEKAKANRVKAVDGFNEFIKQTRGTATSLANTPEFIAKVTKVLAAYAKEGIIKLAEVLKQMRQDFGDKFVDENLADIKEAHKDFQKDINKVLFPAPEAPDIKRTQTSVWDDLKKKAKTFYDNWLSYRKGLPRDIWKEQEKTIGFIAAEINQAKITATKLDALLSKAKVDTDVVDAALRGDADALAGLSQSIAEVVMQMRSHVDNLSQFMIDNGLVAEGRQEIIASNIGEYLNRSYKLFNSKDWTLENVPEQIYNKAAQFLYKQYYPDIKAQMPGATDAEVNAATIQQVKAKINEYFNKGENAFIGNKKIGAKDLSILKQRKDVPPELRALFGEVTDPINNYVQTVFKMANLAGNANFLTQIRNDNMGTLFFEKGDPKRPETHHVEIAGEGSDTMSPLNGLYTTPELAETFNKQSKQVGKIAEVYLRLVGLVKAGKTVGSIITHIKNVEGNLGIALMNGHLDLSHVSEAYKTTRDDFLKADNKATVEIIQKLIKKGVLNQNIFASEVREMFDKNKSSEAFFSRSAGRNRNYWEKTKFYTGKAADKITKMYEAEDNFFKVLGYLQDRDRYAKAEYGSKYDALTPEQQEKIDTKVTELIKDTYPTFSRVPKIARVGSSYGMPLFGNFVAFASESYRVQKNLIMQAYKELKSPNIEIKKIGAQRLAGITAYKGIKYALLTAVGKAGLAGLAGIAFDDEEEKENHENAIKYVAPWSKNSDLIVLQSDHGKLKYIDLSSYDPFGNASSIINASTNPTTAKGGRVGQMLWEFIQPFADPDITAKTGLSLINNKDYYDHNIWEDADDQETKVAKGLAFALKSLEPGTVSTVRRIYDKDNPSKEFGAFVYRTYDVDVAKAFSYKARDYKKELESINRTYTSVYYDRSATEKQKQDALDKANDKADAMLKRMNADYQAAMELGVDKKALSEAMKNQRFNLKIRGALNSGKQAKDIVKKKPVFAE